jgi:hypothetical protein
MVIFETILAAVLPAAASATAKIITEIWQDSRSRSNYGQSVGIVASRQGYKENIPTEEGIFDVPTAYRQVYEQAPLLLEGQFIGDESFIDFADIILNEEEKIVVIIAIDQETGDSYFFEFGFDGYAISMWPGNYLFYAFIVAPILDDVLGYGYPCFEDLQDPNPIGFREGGNLEMDFIIFDISGITS